MSGEWVQCISTLSPSYVLEAPDDETAVTYVKKYLVYDKRTFAYLGRVAQPLALVKVEGTYEVVPKTTLASPTTDDNVRCEEFSELGEFLLGQLIGIRGEQDVGTLDISQ
jgi:hypothetical protein